MKEVNEAVDLAWLEEKIIVVKGVGRKDAGNVRLQSALDPSLQQGPASPLCRPTPKKLKPTLSLTISHDVDNASGTSTPRAEQLSPTGGIVQAFSRLMGNIDSTTKVNKYSTPGEIYDRLLLTFHGPVNPWT